MRQQTGRHRSLNLLRGEVHAGVGGGEPPQFEHGLHPLLVVAVGGVLLPPQAAAEMGRGTEVQPEVGAGDEVNGRPSW